MKGLDILNSIIGKNAATDSTNNGSQESKNSSISVLVVDDDELTRKLIQRLLEREFDVQVTMLSNGLEGLEYAQEHKPDLIILDLMLPGMNGFEFLKKLRKDDLLKNTKVILVSAKSRSEDIERGFDLTADEYITKPFQPKEFVVRVRRLIEQD